MTDARREDEAIVLATYNVHGFVGRDWRMDPLRVARVVRELDADVVALQEVVFPAGEPERPEERAPLPGLEDYAFVSAPTRRKGGLAFGNALLARLPLSGIRRIDLSFRSYEERGALDAWIETHAGPLRVLCTHLGLFRREREWQIARLAEHLRGIGDDMVALLGDFNEWRPGARSLRSVEAELGAGSASGPRSFPTPQPLFALDRIWVRPPGALVDVRTHRSRAAELASDHYPVVARVIPGAAPRSTDPPRKEYRDRPRNDVR